MDFTFGILKSVATLPAAAVDSLISQAKDLTVEDTLDFSREAINAVANFPGDAVDSLITQTKDLTVEDTLDFSREVLKTTATLPAVAVSGLIREATGVTKVLLSSESAEEKEKTRREAREFVNSALRMSSRTETMTTEEWQEFLDDDVMKEASSALESDTSGGIWSGIEWFIKWLRNHVSAFFTTQFVKLPVVGKWASRIGVCVSELMFTVVGTLLGFLKTVFTSPALWKKAHAAAMAAWDANENNGLLAQIFAYGKKMASYFLEIIKQCLERAIIAHKMEVSEEEKADISSQLDDLLNK